jgi:hypothetical protein
MTHPTVQYRKMVYLSLPAKQRWETFSHQHPTQSFNALVNQLLLDYLCQEAPCVTTTKI